MWAYGFKDAHIHSEWAAFNNNVQLTTHQSKATFQVNEKKKG